MGSHKLKGLPQIYTSKVYKIALVCRNSMVPLVATTRNRSGILDDQNGEIYAVSRTTPEYVVIGPN